MRAAAHEAEGEHRSAEDSQNHRRLISVQTWQHVSAVAWATVHSPGCSLDRRSRTCGLSCRVHITKRLSGAGVCSAVQLSRSWNRGFNRASGQPFGWAAIQGLVRTARQHLARVKAVARFTLFVRHPEIVLSVLIEVLRLDGLTAARRVFGEHGVPLIVAARVG